MGTSIHAVHLGRQTVDPMQTHNEHIDPETLAAYALDALPSDELITIGTHLASCPDCQREVASFRSVSEYLPHGLTLAEPPPDLRERVIALAQANPGNRATTMAPRMVRTSVPSSVMHMPWLRRLTPFAVAFALVAGVLFGRYWPTESPSLVEAPGVQSVALTGEGQGTGTFAVAASSNRAQLEVTGLPPLPTGQVYQLWLLDGDTPISVGTFSVDAQGRGRLEFNGLAWSSGYQTVAITAEEQGGSPVPTSNIVIAGGL
jgi:anti-sigma-K factor RskA